MNVLTILTMMLATLRHRVAVTLAVAAGVATATAVISGALLVGDSMRGSLRALTIERLGKIESVIAPGTFFPIDSVTLDLPEVSTTDDVIRAAVILFPGGGVETGDSQASGTDSQASGTDSLRRIGGAQILGIDETFWRLDVAGVTPAEMPGDASVLLNETAARDLNVSVGDLVTLRLPVEAAVPADSPLGRREVRSEGLPRMRVAAIVPDRGLGRFSLSANQAAPPIVFANRETLAEALDRSGQANVLLLDRELAEEAVRLNLRALGWNLKRVQKGDAIDYVSLSCDALMLPDAAVDRIQNAFPSGQVQPVMTYLVNGMRLAKQADAPEVPYSIIAAVDSTGPLKLDYSWDATGGLIDGRSKVPVVLNDWTATRLGASVGSVVEMAYYEPEVTAGNEVERTFDALVTAIVPITAPAKPYRRSREAVFDSPPTAYNDPDLTPSVPGVTDQESISDWDLPFELTRKIDRADDDYWADYRLTPKAFMPLAEGRRLFGSRFGETTGLRIDPSAGDLRAIGEQILAAVGPVRGDLGWAPRLIRSKQLAASGGTTPFDGLFLALSMFVILSAVMLISLLLRLGVLQRMSELGTLLAVGWRPKRVLGLVLGETAIVGAIAAIVGVAGGAGYAAMVLAGLRSWWVDAVTVPFLEFHASWKSVIGGAWIGWLVCMATAYASLRFLRRIDPAAIIGGRRMTARLVDGPSGGRWTSWAGKQSGKISGALAISAIAIAILGGRGGGPAAAGAFVAGGMLWLLAALVMVHRTLQASRGGSKTLVGLCIAAARRNPTRSTLTIGLMATASFLILSLTAFRMVPSIDGTGGYELIAESAQPIFEDLREDDVQSKMLGREAGLLQGANVLAWRMRSGDDASCNNLYRATQPTVLGVTPDGDGNWPVQMAMASMTGDDVAATWQSLGEPSSGTADDPISMIVDQNTAMWALEMRKGVGEVVSFEYETGRPLHFKVVGLLANSVLQGRLMIGDRNFTRAFPHQSGTRFFMFGLPEASSGETDELSSALESRLSDAAIDVRRSDDVLAGLLAVQNTYLQTFQSLGALGLLLGTIGLAVAQLRGVLQRRGELAVMRAVGFTRGRIAALVAGENLFLLLMGVGCGVVTAGLAVLPVVWTTGSSLPVARPLLMLLAICLFGFVAGLIAVVRVSRMPLIDSLRAEDAAIEL